MAIRLLRKFVVRALGLAASRREYSWALLGRVFDVDELLMGILVVRRRRRDVTNYDAL